MHRAVESRRAATLACLLTASAIVSFAAFAHTLSYEFVFDDEGQILRNPWLRDWSNLGRLFTTDVWRFMSATSNYYRPLHMLLYMAGYSIFGLAPIGFHLLNVLIHAGCVVLVGLIAWKLTTDPWVSFAASLLFALNPVHSESVAWIAGVTDPLCALFYFGALFLYLDSGGALRSLKFLMSVLLFFLALLSKEMAFTFPIVAAWADWSLRRELAWRRYAVLVAAFGIYAWMRVSALGRFIVPQIEANLDVFSRLLTMLMLVRDYLAKIFIPFDLNAFHVLRPVTSVISWGFFSSAIVLSASGLAAAACRKNRVALFLFGFAAISLAPLLNIAAVWENVFADRYLYIPSLASAILFPVLAKWVWDLRGRSWGIPGPALGASMLMLVLAGYAVLLANTTLMWRDNLTLYSETLRRSPSATLMANLLGYHHFSHGRYREAGEAYRQAIDLWDKSFIKNRGNLAISYNGLGGISLKEGRYEEARGYFEKAYELDPNRFIVLRDLGAVHIALGEFDRARGYYQRALAINSSDEVVYNNLAVIALAQERYDEAIEYARKALYVHPKLAESFLILGRAYKSKGMRQEARDAYLTAGTLDQSRAGLVESEIRSLDASSPERPGSNRVPD